MLEWIAMYGGFVLFGAFLLVDWLMPARDFPQSKLWRTRGVIGFGVYVAIGISLPLVWDQWLGQYRLFDARGLGHVGGALVGFLVLELGIYLWHRMLHSIPFMFRTFHQMHHSAERVDIYGAFYFHPLDMAGFTLVTSVSLVLVIGVTPQAAVVVIMAANFCSMFQHSNLRTPQWLGYIVQRPESHAVHHERGIQSYNFGDIALWDMIFGTFRNPKTWEGEAGFYEGSADRVWDMLICRDITQEPGISEVDAEDEDVPLSATPSSHSILIQRDAS